MSTSTKNFAAILKGMPQPYLVLDTDLTIVGASDVYLALTDRTLADIIGRNILVAFPENPDAEGTVEQGPLEVSLRHVLETKSHIFTLSEAEFGAKRVSSGAFLPSMSQR